MKNLNFLKKLELGLQLERLVIGIEEPVLVKDLGEILAKIDSGNGGYNVIHGEDIIYQGNYISFLTYDGMGNPKRMSKKVVEELEIHIGGGIVQKRPVIQLDVKFANEDYKKILFSVTDRTDNSHKILISKDFVENTINALIDVGAKNISNMSYDVEYLPVNEAENEFKGVETGVGSKNPKDIVIGKDPSGKEIHHGDKLGPDGKKPSFLDRVNDFANRIRPHGQSQIYTAKADEEIVKAWKESSEIFANYSEFYKKDQKNIQEKMLSAEELKAELLNGGSTNLLIKDGKILANKLRGISLFSYTLKKGDAGPDGSGGEAIKGLEQRRELWFQYNANAKEAINQMNAQEKEAKNAEQSKNVTDGNQTDGDLLNKTETLDDTSNESFKEDINFMLTEDAIDFGGRGIGSKSFNASDMPEGSKGVDEKNKEKQQKAIEMNEEAQKILALKGFICYYIPFYSGDNTSELKQLNENILKGTFDGDMKQFVDGGDGSNLGAVEKVALMIKSSITKNKSLLKKLPGVFALCYSDQMTKGAPRNIKFLGKNCVIGGGEVDFDEIKKKLEEVLGLPEEIEITEENINEVIKMTTTASQDVENEANNVEEIKNIKNELLKLKFPEIENPDDEKSINSLLQLIQIPSEKSASEKSSDEFNLESIKNKLTDLNLPQSENPEDEDSINSLISAISGAQNAEEIDMESIKTKLSQLGLPTSDSIKADNQKPGRVVTRIFKTLGIKNPAPKNQKVTNTDISEVTPQKEKTSKRKTSKATPVTK